MSERAVPSLLFAACTLAACSTPGPAPVESRTQPPPVARSAPAQAVAPAPAPVPAPAVATAPARPAGPPPAEAPVVQSAPVITSGVQARPLRGSEPRPLVAPALVRSEPRGTKLPYSDVALADLRRADPGAPATEPAQPAVEPPARAPEPAPVAPAAPEPQRQASVDPRAGAAAPAAPSAASFDWPARGRVIQPFAEPGNMGIAIAGNPGDPVSAAADGRVIFSGVGPRGFGNLVIVKHDGDMVSVYAHNRALLVKEGQSVRRGQRIAELGDSGTDRPKLHFEIRKAGKPVDPQKLLPPR